jgi:hypothetical protein
MENGEQIYLASTANLDQAGHLDSLEKTLTVFKLSYSGNGKRVYRRFDLIFATPDAYWTGIVGW